ncbi:hypothetical protein JY651_42675 [Pyxidicoccus parkwayensis]|uniref:Uncharacterized protein n=2 Tax=Pyxidicoccus parkwayensis TaxID=2813578 RepID=A0ABX7PDD7_9BACT|nr:hypothetical protein JY651_42675 [Pyxidicoccus parkwaysis]
MAMFYVLRPTQALRQWLEERNVPRWMWLDRPHVWSQMGVGDHDYVGQEENAQTFLKLAVLASFQGDLERATHSPIHVMADHEEVRRQVLGELLGPPPLTVEVFDRWWFLEPAEGLHTVEGTIGHTPVPTLRKVRGPEVLSPTVDAESYTGRRIHPVGQWWEDSIREREEDVPRLQVAVSWVLERLTEKTPHRTCVIRTRPFSLGARVQDVLHVPGWTLHERGASLLEGIKLTLEEPVWGFEDVWNFTYRVYAGERRSVSKGTASLQLEKSGESWTVRSGSLEP